MPEMDGISATARLRETTNIPIILLTAKSEDSDKVLGLNIGADDYITKPFNPVEVIARVRSQLRRFTSLGGMEKETEVYVIGGIRMDDKTKTVTVDGDDVYLTPIEYKMLKLLMQNPTQVLSKSHLLDRISEDTPDCTESSLKIHVSNLRKKLREADGEEHIEAVWGIGFKMR